jgi:hypothetical protein
MDLPGFQYKQGGDPIRVAPLHVSEILDNYLRGALET